MIKVKVNYCNFSDCVNNTYNEVENVYFFVDNLYLSVIYFELIQNSL